MKIVLFQPQIPQNTGNIIRTCAVTGTELVLVRPLGFSISDRWLKRAGLDYWENVKVHLIDDLEDYLESQSNNFYFFSSKSKQRYDQLSYQTEDLLIFGSETEGLPSQYAERWGDQFATIPMVSGQRCLNLATSVGIVTYEASRQLNFTHFI